MKEIKLLGKHAYGKTILVDDDDFKWLSKHKWYFRKGSFKTPTYQRPPYAFGRLSCARGISPKGIHRFIMGVNDSCVIIDHINGNTLDNRKSNLRIVTNQQNQLNRTDYGRWKYPKGIIYKKGSPLHPWKGRVRLSGKSYETKAFSTMEEAVIAYKQLVKDVCGEYTRI